MASRNHYAGGKKRGGDGVIRNPMIALALRRRPVQRSSESILAARAEAESEAASAFPTVPAPGRGDLAITLSRCRSLMGGAERPSVSECLEQAASARIMTPAARNRAIDRDLPVIVPSLFCLP